MKTVTCTASVMCYCWESKGWFTPHELNWAERNWTCSNLRISVQIS